MKVLWHDKSFEVLDGSKQLAVGTFVVEREQGTEYRLQVISKSVVRLFGHTKAEITAQALDIVAAFKQQ